MRRPHRFKRRACALGRAGACRRRRCHNRDGSWNDSLAEAGAEVAGPCRTVKDGLIAAPERDLSAALLDFQLGNETVELVALMLARRNIPFAFYTGQTETGPIRAEWPECKIISKPARPKAIVNTIAEIIDEESTTAADRPYVSF
jgi:hypothetical protein